MINSKISVIMPVYNAERYLSESIESALNQTFTDFELIIINDKSTDNSRQIILNYLKKDSRIVFIDNEINLGPSITRNIGLEIAKGEFIALLDADDIALPNRFEKQITILENNENIGVCGSWFTSFGEHVANKIIKHPEHHNQIKVKFLINCTLGNSTAFFRKSVLGNLPYDKDFVVSEDYKLWSELIVQTQFYIIQESLVRYRIHDTNISRTKIDVIEGANRKIKIKFLSEFGIDENNPNIESFCLLFDRQKGLDFETIKDVCNSESILTLQNKKLGNFDSELLEKMFTKSLSRIIRKAKKQSFELINFTKKNKPKVYAEINFFDKLVMYYKAIIG